jgi:hypothetical protein
MTDKIGFIFQPANNISLLSEGPDQLLCPLGTEGSSPEAKGTGCETPPTIAEVNYG